eukprot:125475-Amphidinium_carterae.2
MISFINGDGDPCCYPAVWSMCSALSCTYMQDVDVTLRVERQHAPLLLLFNADHSSMVFSDGLSGLCISDIRARRGLLSELFETNCWTTHTNLKYLGIALDFFDQHVRSAGRKKLSPVSLPTQELFKVCKRPAAAVRWGTVGGDHEMECDCRANWGIEPTFVNIIGTMVMYRVGGCCGQIGFRLATE